MIKGNNFYSQYKIIKHLDKLIQWVDTNFSYPIMVDFDLTNKCNNQCPLCIGSRNKDQSTVSFEDAKRIIFELSNLGIKSIGFGGGGEPTLNPDFEKILRYVNSLGIESAVYTNGCMISDSIIQTIVECCTWARISLDADSSEMYKKTHGVGGNTFARLLENISKIVIKKGELGSEIVLGTCYLVGSHTIKGIYNASKISKERGVSYIRFRPFLTRENEKNMDSKDVDLMFLEFERAKELEDETFFISYPQNRCEAEYKKAERKRNFPICYIPNFFTSITPDLEVYPCCFLKGNKKYAFGNLSKNSFKEIWSSERRKKIYGLINLKECPNPCQFEKTAEILCNIKHNQLKGNMKIIDILKSIDNPILHANFL